MNPTLDCKGREINEGDEVQCLVAHYSSIRYAEVRRVERVEEDLIILSNGLSPYGTSPYRPVNFLLYKKRKQETTPMLHIAVQWFSGSTMADMASFLNNASSPPVFFAGTTKEEIQGKIRARLHNYPNEQWIILSGNTIGERADPPIRFRSL